MTLVNEMIEQIKLWGVSKPAIHHGEVTPFPLSCCISMLPAPKEAISELDVGPDLETFWSISCEADLFKDEAYGQWGLKIFPPNEVKHITIIERENNPNDLKDTDYVIGSFYGDSDQLIIDSDGEGSERYNVVIRNVIDGREEWPQVAPSFGEFLRQYVKAEGAKFWES